VVVLLAALQDLEDGGVVRGGLGGRVVVAVPDRQLRAWVRPHSSATSIFLGGGN
jgi:hypothetical protein